MGISIHYSGRIADKQRLPQLIDEVQEIATVHGWKYTVYEREFPAGGESVPLHDAIMEENHDGKLYGIDFTPEGSETVSICFLSDGRMSSIMLLALWGNFEKEHVYSIEKEEWNESGLVSSSSEEVVMNEEEYKKLLYSCFTKTQFARPDTHELIIGVMRYISKTYLTDFRLMDEGEFWETGDPDLLRRNFVRNGLLIESFVNGLKNTLRNPGEDLESYIRRIAGQINIPPKEE